MTTTTSSSTSVKPPDLRGDAFAVILHLRGCLSLGLVPLCGIRRVGAGLSRSAQAPAPPRQARWGRTEGDWPVVVQKPLLHRGKLGGGEVRSQRESAGRPPTAVTLSPLSVIGNLVLTAFCPSPSASEGQRSPPRWRSGSDGARARTLPQEPGGGAGFGGAGGPSPSRPMRTGGASGWAFISMPAVLSPSRTMPTRRSCADRSAVMDQIDTFTPGVEVP